MRSPRKEADIPIAPSLYSLSNKMDNSLLAVRDINHIYIVIEWSLTMSENRKHLTLEQRKLIEDGLKDGLNFTQIAKVLRVSVSTISREVKKHRLSVPARTSDFTSQRISLCIYRQHCSVMHLCRTCKSTKFCKNCGQRDCSKPVSYTHLTLPTKA